MTTGPTTAILALLALACVGTSAAPAVQEVKETLALDSDGRFSISMIAGTITVEGWDQSKVQITGTLDDEAELKLSSSTGSVAAKVEYPGSEGNWSHGRSKDCRLVIKVPRLASVEAEGVSVKIAVRDVHGSVQAEAVSGGIDVSGRPLDVEARSVSGSITVHGAQKAVRANSVSGSIDVSLDGGEAHLQSVSGQVGIRGGVLDRVEAESVSGRVAFEGGLARSGRMAVNSHSGSVDVRLVGDVSAKVSLGTFSGSIDSAFDGGDDGKRGHTSVRKLEHTIGDGDGRVRINTFSGSIRLR